MTLSRITIFNSSFLRLNGTKTITQLNPGDYLDVISSPETQLTDQDRDFFTKTAVNKSPSTGELMFFLISPTEEQLEKYEIWKKETGRY